MEYPVVIWETVVFISQLYRYHIMHDRWCKWYEINTRIESEGSEPDKAACLAAARLSTSSMEAYQKLNLESKGISELK